jgi:hypothetical protein
MADNEKKTYPHLKPWKPGQSGNPSGRPKKLPITDAVQALTNLPLSTLPTKILNKLKRAGFKPTDTFGVAIGHAQFLEALKGNTKAFLAIADRIEGKPTQKVELSGNVSGIDVTIRHVKPKRANKN